MKTMLAAAAAAFGLLASAHAEVRTYQGSTRWAATLFTPNVRTTQTSTSYITYFIMDVQNGFVVDAIKIDAWTTRSGRFYVVDDNFFVEYDFFGFGAVGGVMETDELDVSLPFRGVTRSGRLDALTLYPATDYYPRNQILDITTITGSARFNPYFSGNVSLNTAANAILDFLESRGYYEY
jgi:hypothetical protein